MAEGTTPLTFFDTCVRIGRPRAPSPVGNAADTERLLACMQRHHLVAAAVEHAVAREAAPRLGHELLQRDLAGHESLRPAWHLMPAVSERIERAVTDPEEFLSHHVALGRVDARDFCDGRGDRACFAPVLAACEAIRLPVFLDFRFQGNIGTFDFDICHLYPQIPFVIEGFGVYPLHRVAWCLKAYPNLHISTVGMAGFSRIDLLCELVGVRRLLFGSGWPAQSLGMAIGHVVFADIPQTDRQRIAADNFEELLEGIGS